MEKKRVFVFRILMTILFSGAVLAAFFYSIFGEFSPDMKVRPEYLAYACPCLCFLFSLLFIRKDTKKLFLTLALAVTVAADYFLLLSAPTENNNFIGVCIFCGVQFVYFVYTLFLNQSIGTRIFNIATRVALCLVAYFVLPMYLTLGTIELIALMYIINFFVSLLVMFVHIKTEWLTLLGYFVFFVSDIFVGLQNGGAAMIGITGPFLEFVQNFDIAFYTYIPSQLIIAISSGWAKKKEN